jgi:hypothetical protein
VTGFNVWHLMALLALGAILANLIVNPSATTTLVGYIDKVYKWAVNSMMGGNG